MDLDMLASLKLSTVKVDPKTSVSVLTANICSQLIPKGAVCWGDSSGGLAIFRHQHSDVLQPDDSSVKTAMALSLVTSGLNALGSVAAIRSPQLNMLESTQFDANATCPSFKSAANAPSWNCMSCLKVECGFCANAVNEVICPRSMSGSDERYEECMSAETSYLVQGWLPKQNWVPGSHTAGIVHHFLLPWDGNRAMGCQLQDLSTKVQRSLWRASRSFQLGLQSHSQRVFLNLNQGSWFRWHLPPLYWVSVIGITCIYVFVPETKGLSFEEVEKLLETGFMPKAFRKKKFKE
ncbi:hypothetical protein GOBAR_DD30058 [Gossypium barbadense]|nr:hypothetical protein GOBAR_DD30058 [Gossypium barbadense]